MKKAYSIQEYNYIYDNKRNNTFRLIFIMLIIGIIIILFKYDFYIYEENILIKENDNYKLVVDATNINKISKNKYIYINNKKYKYKFVKEELDYVNNNGTILETIQINIPNYNNEANIIKCHFLKNKKTLINIIIDNIRGG